jgi:hypothetical protein
VRVRVNLCRLPSRSPERFVRVVDPGGREVEAEAVRLRDVSTVCEGASGWLEGDLVWVRNPSEPLQVGQSRQEFRHAAGG